MPSPFRLHLFILVIGTAIPLIAVAEKQVVVTSIEQILRAIPLGTNLGTKVAINPVAAEVASKETNKFLYKPAKLKFKVRRIEKIHSKIYQTDYRIEGEDVRMTVGSTPVKVRIYLYFVSKESITKLAKLKEKDIITVTGLVRRADFVQSGPPTFMFDLIDSDTQ